MKKIILLIHLVLFPAWVSAACVSYNPMPTGEFSEGVMENLKLVPENNLLMTYTIYLGTFKMVSSGDALTCGYFTINTGHSPGSLTGAQEATVVDFYLYRDVIKIVNTAFALNYYLEGSVSTNPEYASLSPSMFRSDFISMRPRP